MLEKLMKLYVAAMSTPGGVGAPVPHLFGPPGCGKSSMVSDLANVVGKKLHIINVSRVSPLELEGVQMPDKENAALRMLPATFWTQLEDGDVVLLDEFLRGFPEVYNGLLDIITSRRVGAYQLKKVFIIAASNTTVSYDKALEDRLLHLKVPDPRKDKTEKMNIKQRIVKTLGLHPDTVNSEEMNDLVTAEILPMYEVLDKVGTTSMPGTPSTEGHSIRNLIGQAQLREVQSSPLKDLIASNNSLAMRNKQAQFVFLTAGHGVDPRYQEMALKLKGNPRLTEVQAHNLEINLQLIELEEERKKKEDEDDDLFPIAG